MNLWQSLLLTGSGGTLTLVGTWIAFRLQARERRRESHEVMLREDALRLHKERMSSYASFHQEGGVMRARLGGMIRSQRLTDTIRAAREQRNKLWDACSMVMLIGSKDAASSAWDLLNYATAVIDEEEEFASDRWSRLIWGFVYAARADLLYPHTPGATRADVWDFSTRDVVPPIDPAQGEQTLDAAALS